MRIAAIGDMHIRESSAGAYGELFANICQKADVLVLAGDLTDQGLPREAEILRDELRGCTIQILAVLGNHDYENGRQEELTHILSGTGNFRFLENQPVEIGEVGFAGAKGFAGGFDVHMLQSWGEPIIKQFVQEAANEAMLLEGALAKLRTPHKVAVLHYAPIRQTVEGEPPEIYPFLGSSRVVQSIENFRVSAVFHGHAHSGASEGRTAGGVPVYNVSLPLLRRTNPENPFVIIEL
jgi:hypothetical protein